MASLECVQHTLKKSVSVKNMRIINKRKEKIHCCISVINNVYTTLYFSCLEWWSLNYKQNNKRPSLQNNKRPSLINKLEIFIISKKYNKKVLTSLILGNNNNDGRKEAMVCTLCPNHKIRDYTVCRLDYNCYMSLQQTTFHIRLEIYKCLVSNLKMYS